MQLYHEHVVTTTYGYDNNGNLTSAGTSTFSWDYNNRMTQAVTQGSTSTYSYDDQLNRVSQTVGGVTTIYPNKFYSVASSTSGGKSYSTTTVYVWNGDTLVATIDQAFINGTATGTAAMRYIHPDHLGSTNVISDESGNVVDNLEYYPYGETRLNQPSYPTNAQRQYIAQFKDGNSLSYLQSRYYDGSKGEFLSEDPVFLGDPRLQVLTDPQSLNSYSYANDNPITKSDPTGRQCVACAGAEVLYSLGAQTAYDGVFGQSSSAVYGGDIVGASLYGFAYPWTLVAGVAAAAGGAGNAAQQGFEYLSGDRASFDPSQVQSSGLIAGGTQLALGFLPVPFIGSSALAKQMATKLEKGTISRVSNNTMTKIAASNAPGSFVGNFATTYAQTQFNNLNLGSTRSYASALSMALPGSNLSTTISIAQAAIQLAQSAIASYKASSR